MRYTLLITGPAYGTQNSISALLFAKTLLNMGHKLESVFFYRDGVSNASDVIAPASDEINIVDEWKKLSQKHNVALNVCQSASFRRGVMSSKKKIHSKLELETFANFEFTGLSVLIESLITCDRVVQF